MTREEVIKALNESNGRRPYCVTGATPNGMFGMVRLEKAVPGDADFQSAKLYRVSTLHQDLAARELANVTLTVEFYDDPNKAIDVLAAAGIKAFEKCRPPREL